MSGTGLLAVSMEMGKFTVKGEALDNISEISHHFPGRILRKQKAGTVCNLDICSLCGREIACIRILSFPFTRFRFRSLTVAAIRWLPSASSSACDRAVPDGKPDLVPLRKPVDKLDAIVEYCYRAWITMVEVARKSRAMPRGLLHGATVLKPSAKGWLINAAKPDGRNAERRARQARLAYSL